MVSGEPPESDVGSPKPASRRDVGRYGSGPVRSNQFCLQWRKLNMFLLWRIKKWCPLGKLPFYLLREVMIIVLVFRQKPWGRYVY